jgi:hypothetical protein
MLDWIAPSVRSSSNNPPVKPVAFIIEPLMGAIKIRAAKAGYSGRIPL